MVHAFATTEAGLRRKPPLLDFATLSIHFPNVHRGGIQWRARQCCVQEVGGRRSGAVSRGVLVMDRGLSENGSLNICHLFFFCSSCRGPMRSGSEVLGPHLISAPVIAARMDGSGPWPPPDTCSTYSNSVPVNHRELEATQNLTDTLKG